MKAPVEKIKLRNKPLIKVLLTSLLAFLAAGAPPAEAAQPVRVVVLPPVRVGETLNGPDKEADGVARTLEYEIGSPGSIEVVPRQDVGRIQQVQDLPKGTEINFDQAFELARLAGARFVIWGSFQKAGDTYRFNMVLGDAPNETVKKLRSTKSDLFGIQDDLAAQAKKLIQQAGVAMAADGPVAAAPAAPAAPAAGSAVAVTLSTADAPEAQKPAVQAAPVAKAPVAKAVPPPAPPKPDLKRQAREMFNSGARIGDYSDKERDYYLKAAQLDPAFAEPYYALGELYYQRQQNREALTAFEKYLFMKPTAPEATDVRTVIADLKKQFGEPVAAPMAPPPGPAAGPAASPAAGSAPAAAPVPAGFTPAPEQANWPAARWYNEGLKLEQTDKQKYVDYLKQALKVDPNFPPAYYNLGYDCYERNQYREARDYFEKYLQLAPNAADAQQIRDLLVDLKKY